MFLFAGVIGAFNNPSSHDELCRRLVAGTDSTAIAVDCRPAPEHPHPATANDAYAAMQHVAKKAGCSE